ncbi:MAG TPA: GNAT family N-acetyltransferase [Devosia sp.]|nr:GNAT family N-acetyltransferase [Devosia sp.]
MTVDIRLARPDDRLKLVELQRRASLMWNDVRDKLLDRPELIDEAVPPEMIANNQVFVAHRGAHIVGFATIIAHEGNDAELEGLFVEPSEWRKGIGTALVEAVEREAQAWGASRLHVLANRNVTGFYEAAGFEALGERKTPLGPVAVLMAKPVSPI